MLWWARAGIVGIDHVEIAKIELGNGSRNLPTSVCFHFGTNEPEFCQ
jgi:hypothetical protein